MNFWGWILKRFHWTVDINPEPPAKCVICVAPHTSNWDFIMGILAYHSIGRKANFLMKEAWFFFPLGYILKALGGIPVPKVRGSALSATIIEKFKTSDYLNLAVTPEGTRSKTKNWRKGFIHIAEGSNVPIYLGVIDFSNRKIIIHDKILPTGNVDADLMAVQRFYLGFPNAAKYPEKFDTADF